MMFFVLICLHFCLLFYFPHSFSFSETRIGMVPATICPFVMRKIGLSATRQLFLTGEIFKVKRAQELGLVHKIMRATSSQQQSMAFFYEKYVLPVGPESARRCKQLIVGCVERGAFGLEDFTVEIFDEAIKGKELKEGAMAALGKTKPGWAKL